MREDWVEIKLGDISFTSSGGTPSRQNKSYFEGNIPWVKSGELDKGLILDSEEHISEEAVKNSSAKLFPKGTLLFVLYGAAIGKMATLGISAASNQAICGIYENDILVSEYLYHYLSNKKRELIGKGIGGAQPNISSTKIEKFDLIVPATLEEQHQIVREIESRLSVYDKVEQSITESLEKTKALRQSILKKAFEGSLLSVAEIEQCKQAPDYEPASVLLGKIKIAKLGQAITKPQKVKTTKRKPPTPAKISTDIQAGVITKVIQLYESNLQYLDNLTHVKCEM